MKGTTCLFPITQRAADVDAVGAGNADAVDLADANDLFH